MIPVIDNNDGDIMKKVLLAAIFSMSLVGCTIDTMTKAHTNVSNFDGSKEIYSQPMYVFATTGFHAAPILLGARWSDKTKDSVAIDVEVMGDYTNIDNLYLNIDGNIKGYKAIQALTKLSTPDSRTFSQRTSKKSFLVPVSDIEKIKASKSVKIKVTTLSDGYYEGVVISNERQSPGAKSMINVIDQIRQ